MQLKIEEKYSEENNKTISYVLLVVFLVFALAGCGETEEKDTAGEGKETWVVGISRL